MASDGEARIPWNSAGRPTGATTTLGNLQRATPRVWVYCEECPTARRWLARCP
jgi:hypothetical protein